MRKILLFSLVVFAVCFNVDAQENKYKPVVFGDVRGFYQYVSPDATEGFVLNVARIGVKGSLNDYISYKVIGNLATLGSLTTKKDAAGKVTDVKAKFGEILQDALIKLTFDKSLYFTFGQFKVPVSTDNYRTPLEIDFINRSFATSVTPELRDVGGEITFSNSDLVPLEIKGGLFNGAGVNKTETDRMFNKAIRGVVKPIKELSVGGSYYWGTLLSSTVGIVDFGATLKVSGLMVDVEYAIRNVDSTNNYQRKSSAFYGYALYNINYETKFFKTIQPGLRFDYYEPDNNFDENEQNRLTFGLSFLLNENSFNQVKVNYEIIDYKNPLKDSIKRFYVAFQTAF